MDQRLMDAIELALNGGWDEAHRIVQQHDDKVACWIHAVLHRIEGDKGNSEYWYRRAGKEFETKLTPKEELGSIKRSLA